MLTPKKVSDPPRRMKKSIIKNGRGGKIVDTPKHFKEDRFRWVLEVDLAGVNKKCKKGILQWVWYRRFRTSDTARETYRGCAAISITENSIPPSPTTNAQFTRIGEIYYNTRCSTPDGREARYKEIDFPEEATCAQKCDEDEGCSGYTDSEFGFCRLYSGELNMRKGYKVLNYLPGGTLPVGYKVYDQEGNPGWKGCYIRNYNKKKYGPPTKPKCAIVYEQVLYFGDAKSISEGTNEFDSKWKNKINSLEVMDGCNLSLYDSKNTELKCNPWEINLNEKYFGDKAIKYKCTCNGNSGSSSDEEVVSEAKPSEPSTPSMPQAKPSGPSTPSKPQGKAKDIGDFIEVVVDGAGSLNCAAGLHQKSSGMPRNMIIAYLDGETKTGKTGASFGVSEWKNGANGNMVEVMDGKFTFKLKKNGGNKNVAWACGPKDTSTGGLTYHRATKAIILAKDIAQEDDTEVVLTSTVNEGNDNSIEVDEQSSATVNEGNDNSIDSTSQEVSCGNHTAASCDKCPQGNGKSWCNSDCKWVNKKCIDKKQKIAVTSTTTTTTLKTKATSTTSEQDTDQEVGEQEEKSSNSNECATINNKGTCKFPWTYTQNGKKKTLDGCEMNAGKYGWCATELDSAGEIVRASMGMCSESCPKGY